MTEICANVMMGFSLNVTNRNSHPSLGTIVSSLKSYVFHGLIEGYTTRGRQKYSDGTIIVGTTVRLKRGPISVISRK